MKIPDKIKIGNITYDVKFVKNPDRHDKKVDGNINYGCGEINISNGFDESEDYKEQVFLHECVHGMLNFIAFQKQDAEDKEVLTDKLSKVFHMFIKDNPDMFKEDI